MIYYKGTVLRLLAMHISQSHWLLYRDITCSSLRCLRVGKKVASAEPLKPHPRCTKHQTSPLRPSLMNIRNPLSTLFEHHNPCFYRRTRSSISLVCNITAAMCSMHSKVVSRCSPPARGHFSASCHSKQLITSCILPPTHTTRVAAFS